MKLFKRFSMPTAMAKDIDYLFDSMRESWCLLNGLKVEIIGFNLNHQINKISDLGVNVLGLAR